MITDKLKTLVATHIKDSLFDSADIGLGGNATNPTSNALDVPLGLTLNVSNGGLVITNSALNVIEVKVSVAGTSIQGKVIREVALFDGSDMVYRTNFDGVGPFSTTETLELFILLEVE
tara:strand:- start:161 stop:514 length:354 start_codon:yes stop_codon:yes gene_type:complete